jgi:hypothetical protein
MRPVTILGLAALAVLGSISACHAETKLLWRTNRTTGFTVGFNQGKHYVVDVPLDVSAYDRLRVVAVARRPTSVLPNLPFGIPVRVELRIGGDGDEDLGLLENGVLVLNPTNSTTADSVPARTFTATAVYDNPVITRLRLHAQSLAAVNQQVGIDLYVYGQTSALAP